jgi:ammonium transporter, Amt family
MQATPSLSAGNTAWVIMATAMVMFMTVPALGLFYGGLVRRKNVLSILMQCFITLALVSVLWVAFGYSLAFSDGELIPGVLGDFKWAFFRGIGPDDLSPFFISDAAGRVPHLAFAMFQGMFAVITPALIVGAFAERMKFSSFLIFTCVWEILIYSPLAHMVWAPGGWLYRMGVMDFAGGIVVHINAGFAALASAIVIGKRNNLKALPPHNLPYTLIGAAMLWFGWFGFNAGSSLAADGIALNALVTTNLAAAVAGLVWPILDKIVNKRSTILGTATGAIVGLGAITPASGFVGVGGAIAIGAVASACGFVMVTFVKERFGYDDALDTFGCHGVGGLVGTLLAGVFANPAIWKGHGAAYAGALYGNPRQFLVQLAAAAATMAISFGGTFAILKLVDALTGLRVDSKDEAIGLDIALHHERAYTVLD